MLSEIKGPLFPFSPPGYYEAHNFLILIAQF